MSLKKKKKKLAFLRPKSCSQAIQGAKTSLSPEAADDLFKVLSLCMLYNVG
jgi:hypothetical protein